MVIQDHLKDISWGGIQGIYILHVLASEVLVLRYIRYYVKEYGLVVV